MHYGPYGLEGSLYFITGLHAYGFIKGSLYLTGLVRPSGTYSSDAHRRLVPPQH